MTLSKWREVAIPRKDIQDGTFVEATFAADLGMVAQGLGSHDYQDPELFLQQTYPTGDLRRLLVELARRLAGDASVRGVHRMQTKFGGGKTHAMLTAYHVFRRDRETVDVPLVTELLDALDGHSIPRTNVVVLDGGALHPGTPEDLGDGVRAHTLLGLLAHGLGGPEAYAAVADQDAQLLPSSTVQLRGLLKEYTPCLILLDEALEYLVKAHKHASGTDLSGKSNAFIKDLCTAVSNTPGAAIVATLTASREETYSRDEGELLYRMLSNAVGRTESVVTPVQGDEVFSVLQRRLFTTVGSPEDRWAVARAYLEYYEQELGQGISGGYRSDEYKERIAHAYPFHPALLDILIERWDGIPRYQRTRSALRMLAHTVNALWESEHDGLLIRPGDVDLADRGVVGEVLEIAGPEFSAVLAADIAAEDANASKVDQRWGQAGTFRVGTGLAATAFLCSHSPEKARGASTEDLLIGVGAPGISRAVMESVRDELDATLWYMRMESGRYLFSTQANLNRILLLREGTITVDRIENFLQQEVEKVVGEHGTLLKVERVVDSQGSRSIPDTRQLTLGVLGSQQHLVDAEHGGPDENLRGAATNILQNCGATYRSYKNTAMLIVADLGGLNRAWATARTLLALRDLRDDPSRSADLTDQNRQELTERIRAAEQRLPDQLIMAYRHLILLGTGSNGAAELEHRDLGLRVANSIGDRVLEELRVHERLADELSPGALLTPRFGLFPNNVDAVELDKLLDYFAQQPRLPKLASADVLRAALVEGVRQGLFALVSGASWQAADAVIRFREQVDRTEIRFQPGTFLVRAEAAEQLLRARQPQQPQQPPPQPGFQPSDPTSTTTDDEQTPGLGPQPSDRQSSVKALQLTVRGIPGERMRELVRVAVLPLNQVSVTVSVDLTVTADGGTAGIPRETLSLNVLEGLRQLGLDDVTVEPPEAKGP